MPTLDIQGREVEVGDGFLKLSSKDQNDFVMHIASSLGMKAKEDSSPSQISDIAKGIGGGLVRGAAGTLGMITDTLPNALVAGSDYIAKKMPGVDAADYDRQAAQRDKAYDASKMGRALST